MIDTNKEFQENGYEAKERGQRRGCKDSSIIRSAKYILALTSVFQQAFAGN
jgi:hypothetical protein